MTDRYDYDAWGNTVNTSGATPNSYLYRGEQFDPDLNLYYLRARYFNPLSGRFLTLDPYRGRIQDPGTMHRYSYTRNDPVNRIDPRGSEDAEEYSVNVQNLTTNAAKAARRLRVPARAFLRAIETLKQDSCLEFNDDVLIDVTTGNAYLGVKGAFELIGCVLDYLVK